MNNDKPIYTYETATIKAIKFSVLTNKEALKMSALEQDKEGITTSDLYEQSNEPIKNGLLDKRMGVNNNSYSCETCQYKMNYCDGHFGHLKLSNEVFNIKFFDDVISILNIYCTHCSSLLWNKSYDELYEIVKKKKNRERIKKLKDEIKLKNCHICNTPVGKVKGEKKNGEIIVSIEREINGKIEIEKKTTKQVFNILKNIKDSESEILNITCHPKDLMLEILPIPPVSIRTSYMTDTLSDSITESTLTMRLTKIYKSNMGVKKQKEKEKENDTLIKHSKTYIDQLQAEIACYVDNESLKTNKPGTTSQYASIVTKIKGSKNQAKKGRIRGNLMGKRVNQYGRTVISPDPLLDMNQAYVPVSIAKNLTYPEIVTPNNITKLTKLVQNGSNIYPGANSITLNRTGNQVVIDNNKVIELNIGDVVDRHLIDGDIVLLNRQPTLHKYGSLAHYIKIKNDDRFNTIRINPSVCAGYGADFDGDEMNIFTVQSILTDIELEYLTNVKSNIISAKSSLPIVGAVFDAIIAPYNITKFCDKIDNDLIIDLLTSTNLEDYKIMDKNKNYSGKTFFDLIIPDKISLKNDSVIIKNGKIIEGFIDGKSIKEDKNNTITQDVWNVYGPDMTQSIIDNITKLSINFNLNYGFTISLNDYLISTKIHKSMEQMFKTKKIELLYKLTEFENNIINSKNDNFEMDSINLMKSIVPTIGEYIINNLNDENNNKIMIKSKSKGNEDNLTHMIGCVGQQDYDGVRVPKNYNNRTLPYFHQNDDSALSRGFIESSLTKGMNLEEFIVLTNVSRNSLITQAVKTAETGYLQRKLIKAGEDIMIKYDNYVRNAYDKIYQFVYGDCGLDSTRYNYYNFELINKGNKDIEKEYKFSSEELKKVKFTNEENNKYYERIINIRDKLRDIKMKSSLNYYLLDKKSKSPKSDIKFLSPINIDRIIELSITENFKGDIVEPKYILDKIDYILKMNTTYLLTFDEDNLKNSKFKYMDDRLIKKIFKYYLIDSLNIKKCIFNLKLTKKHIDYISDNIIMNYNNSIVEPGDMVGILGAQTLGEPATQMTISAFHTVGSGAGTEGVPRLLEIYGSSPNMKSQMMTIFFDNKYNKNEKYLTKITSNIINTSIKDIIDNIIIYYDENKSFDSKLMKDDRIINNIFSVSNPNKNSCINNINNLNWVIKIEFNEEKMLSREINLLNIKTRICEEWENRFKDNKGSKKEIKKKLFNKILQIALLSNSENDNNPIIHIRFNIINYVMNDFIEFINIFIKEIQIKGINNIINVVSQKPIKYNNIYYDNDGVKEDYEYIIKTNGINMNEIFKIKGINLNKLYINDLREVERVYGIEAARTLIINELIETYKNKGIDINYCHFSIFADIQISLGSLISLERHGLVKLKTSPLAKASFERPVDILVNAGLYGEVDNMKSVSSRIIGGLCFLGGSNLSNVAIDRELIENSEYTLNETIDNKNVNEVSNNITKEINENVFIPDLF